MKPQRLCGVGGALNGYRTVPINSTSPAEGSSISKNCRPVPSVRWRWLVRALFDDELALPG